jgi:Ca2+-transporting ATPase
MTGDAAELFVVLVGLATLALFHVAPSITAIQILAIDVVAQILPITALGWDKAQSKLMHEKPRNLHDHIINRTAIGGFIGFGALAGVLAYANFLLFFARHHLSPRFLDPTLPLYHQATTLTYLTLVLCLYVYLLFERSDRHERFFTSYLWSNRKLLIAFGVSFALITNVIYNPWLQPYLGSASLNVTDWLTALLCGGLYMAFRLLQRHTRKHTRQAILGGHHPDLIKKHLKIA